MSRNIRHNASTMNQKEKCPAYYCREKSSPLEGEVEALRAIMVRGESSGVSPTLLPSVDFCRDFVDSRLRQMSTPILFREMPFSIGRNLVKGIADWLIIDGVSALLIVIVPGGIDDPLDSDCAQGCALALGAFEMFSELQEISVIRLYPFREIFLEHNYHRNDSADLFLRLSTIVRRANAKHKPQIPGLHCCSCRKQANCSALITSLSKTENA